jgi:hypothetical protein
LFCAVPIGGGVVFTGGALVFTGGMLGGGGIEVSTGGGTDAGGGGAEDCADARPQQSNEARETQSMVVFMVFPLQWRPIPGSTDAGQSCRDCEIDCLNDREMGVRPLQPAFRNQVPRIVDATSRREGSQAGLDCLM